MAKKKATSTMLPVADYSGLLGEIVSLLEAARRMYTNTLDRDLSPKS